MPQLKGFNKGSISLLLVVFLSCVYYTKASDVLEANKDNFDEMIQTGLSLVEFYAPWCGHCKSLVPHWEEAATEMKGHANFIKIDATVEQELAGRYDIQGYPTIKVFYNGEASDYEGGRQTADFITFVKRTLAPAVHIIRSEQRLEELKSDRVTVVLYTSDESGPAMESFLTYANKLRNTYRFVAVVHEDLFGTNVEGDIVLLKLYDEPEVKYIAEQSEDLTTWIHSEAFPLLSEIGPDNYRQYVERGIPIAWLFYNLATGGPPTHLIMEAAKTYKNKISFVYLDGVRYHQLLSRYGYRESDALPLFLIENSGNFWRFPTDTELSVGAINTFCVDFASGTLQRTILSEEIPEPATVNGLTTLVGHTINEVIQNHDKDVLVEFYAPWCGHCKTLTPIYEALAAKVKDVDTLVIAKIDATNNEINNEMFDVTGFPTLYFKPAGKAPMPYDGERTLEGMMGHIKAHATHSFVVQDDEIKPQQTDDVETVEL